MSDSEHWSIQDSAALYGLDRWGDPYFSINGRGHISVQPQGDRGGSLDLVDLVSELKSRNLALPLLASSSRFSLSMFLWSTSGPGGACAA